VAYRVNFTGFWPSFNPEENLFRYILERELKIIVKVVGPGEKSDLEITSVFHLNSTLNRGAKYLFSKIDRGAEREYEELTRYGILSRANSSGKKRVWYTGENFRTPFGHADGYLGFDPTDEIENVVYFPHWMFRLFSEMGKSSREFDWNIENLMSNRPSEIRDMNACIFSSSVVPRRIQIIRVFQEFVTVESFGKAFGNRVQSKADVSSNFGLQICPENSLYPGYVTEKVFEAWMCGNVPVWEGLDPHSYLNPRAMLDITGLNVSELRNLLRNIDEETLLEMRSQAILRRIPELEPVVKLFASVI